LSRERLADELRLVVPSLRKQRPQRAVDHAGGEDALLTRAPLATEERARDLADGVVPLLDVDRQRQEVHIAEVAGGRGAQHHRVAALDNDRSTRLAGELAGLERDLLAAYLDRDAAHVKHAHVFVFPFRPPSLRPLDSSTFSI